jgi:hypothetical protein
MSEVHIEFCSNILKEAGHLEDLWEDNFKTGSREVKSEDVDFIFFL